MAIIPSSTFSKMLPFERPTSTHQPVNESGHCACLQQKAANTYEDIKKSSPIPNCKSISALSKEGKTY